MRVLHAIGGVSRAFGGPSQAVLDLCRELAASGVEVEIVTSDSDPSGRLRAPAGAPMVLEGVPARVFHSPTLRKYGFAPGLGRWLSGQIARFDLVHVHGVFSYPGVMAHRAARRAGRPCLVRPLGQLDPWSLGSGSPLKAVAYRAVVRPMLRRAAAIHVTSEMEARSVAALGFGGKARVVPLGLTVPPAQAARPRTSPFRLLFLGRIDPKKALPVVLEAVKAVRDGGHEVSLTIAGSGAPAYVRAIERRVAGLALERAVTFTGFVAGPAKTRVLAEAQAFVLPSYQENFGLAVAEAMAAGLPVIVSDRVALAADVRESGGGLVVPCDDPGALAGAIRTLVSDRDLAEQMGGRGRALAARKFAWPRVVADVTRIYAGLVAPSSATLHQVS